MYLWTSNCTYNHTESLGMHNMGFCVLLTKALIPVYNIWTIILNKPCHNTGEKICSADSDFRLMFTGGFHIFSYNSLSYQTWVHCYSSGFKILSDSCHFIVCQISCVFFIAFDQFLKFIFCFVTNILGWQQLVRISNYRLRDHLHLLNKSTCLISQKRKYLWHY